MSMYFSSFSRHSLRDEPQAFPGSVVASMWYLHYRYSPHLLSIKKSNLLCSSKLPFFLRHSFAWISFSQNGYAAIYIVQSLAKHPRKNHIFSWLFFPQNKSKKVSSKAVFVVVRYSNDVNKTRCFMTKTITKFASNTRAVFAIAPKELQIKHKFSSSDTATWAKIDWWEKWIFERFLPPSNINCSHPYQCISHHILLAMRDFFNDFWGCDFRSNVFFFVFTSILSFLHSRPIFLPFSTR